MVQFDRLMVSRLPSAAGRDLRGLVASLVCALALFVAVLSPAAAEGRRVALVIGNSNYLHVQSLPNPVNDAEDLAGSLSSLGFDVMLKTDLDKRGMDRTLADFARVADGADVALLYYAGHGVQYEGQNYVVPVDAELKDEIAIQYDSIPVDDLIGTFSRVTGARVLVLDACRDNPVKGPPGDPPLSRGLARINSPRGMLIASATQANEVAFDGTGRNGIFTGAILQTLETPGLEVHEMFRRVTALVSEESGGQQTPEMSSSIGVPLVLNAAETAEFVWGRIRDSDDPATFIDFITRYPDSLLVDAARSRIELLRRVREQAELEAKLAEIEADRSAETQQRQAVDATRAEDDARRAEEARRLEEARKAEEARAAEDAGKQEEARAAEQVRLAAEAQRQQDALREARTDDLARIHREQEERIRKARDEERQREDVARNQPGTSTGDTGEEETVASLGTEGTTPDAGGLVLQPDPAVSSLQAELVRVGCRAAVPDGILDAATRTELRTYLAAAGLDQTASPDNPKLLAHLREDRMAGCRAVAQKAAGKAETAKLCASILERLQAGDEPTDDDRAALETYCR